MNYLEPFETKRAHPGIESTAADGFDLLPPPSEQVVVAVYRFRDQTGQYKASERTASWSTAVTQGATSILMRSLEESGWFVPIEREGLSNLLNERQIIQSTRAQHAGPDGEPLGQLPPLLYAGVLLEGGVIGYDTNLITGGAGARYLGVGPSGQYRRDQVTIYLRAVSTQSGRVLKTVHTTKTIVSQKLDGGLFQFVDVDRILETEAGYSYNEPPVLAVTEAIDEAVKNLVIEGIRDGMWAPRGSFDADSGIFAAYDDAQARTDRTDYFDRVVRDRPDVSMGVSVDALQYQGDYHNPLITRGVSGFIRTSLTQRLSIGLGGSFGEVAAENAFDVSVRGAELQVHYTALPGTSFSPIVTLGFGLLQQDEIGLGDGIFPYISGAAGFEYMVVPRFGFHVLFGNQYPLEEGLDGIHGGRIHDNVWAFRTGLSVHLGN